MLVPKKRSTAVKKAFVALVCLACVVMLGGCKPAKITEVQIGGSETAVVPATLPTTLTIVGENFGQNSKVVFAIETEVPGMWDKDPASVTADVVVSREAWEDGVTVEPISVSDDQTTITVESPVLLGLLKSAPVTVTVDTSGDSNSLALLYVAPPKVEKVTLKGDVDPLNEEWTCAVVPAQVPTPVAVDGLNIDDGAAATWVLEGVDEPAQILVNGGFVNSPNLSNTELMGPARVGLKVTNKDGQSDVLDYALLCSAPPVLLHAVRDDRGYAHALPYPETEVPAEVCAKITLCGRNIRTNCGYVKFTDPDGREIGRTDLTENESALPTEGTYYDEADGIQCISDVATPKVMGLTAPMDVTVSVQFPDGQATEMPKAVGTITLIPPAQLTAAAPAAVPMTPVADDENVKITLTGSYIHPDSEVKVRWSYIGVNDDVSDYIGETEWIGYRDGVAISDNTLTFPRPALTTGRGSVNDPVGGDKMAVTARLNENREAAFVVVDPFGQESKLLKGVTYTIPPIIYQLQVTDVPGGQDVAATRTEKWQLTGRNWLPGVTFAFERRDNGMPLTPSSMPAEPTTGPDNGIQSIEAGTPIWANPPAVGSTIPVRVTVTNPDGQSAVGDMQYQMPNWLALLAVNYDTRYPEVGATKAAPTAPAAVTTRTVDIKGFNGTPVSVSFLDAAGNLIGDPVNGDNPVTNTHPTNWVALSGDWLTVIPPVDATFTAPTNVYVKVTTADGQETPADQLGVLVYKPAPVVTTLVTKGYGTPEDPTAFPAGRRTNNPDGTPRDTEFDLTGDNLLPSLPAARSAARAWLTFTANIGGEGPGLPGFTGTQSQTADVFFAETGMGFGNTPVFAGVTLDHKLPAMSFYDLYGQEAKIDAALLLNIVAGPTVAKVEGVFKNYKGDIRTEANLAPGRNGDASLAPTFKIAGTNLDRAASVSFSSDQFKAVAANGNVARIAAPVASFATQTAFELIGTLPQLTKTTMPNTLTDVAVSVTAKDGQVADAPDAMTLTAPPRVKSITNGNGVLSKSFIANPAPAADQVFVLTGEQIQSGGTGFAVAFDAGLNVTPIAANATTASFSLQAQTGETFITDKLGDLPFTFTNYMAQSVEVPDVLPEQYLPVGDLTLLSARGVVPLVAGAEGTTANVGMLVSGQDVITVSCGQWLDFEAGPAGTIVDTLRIDVWKGKTGVDTLISDAPADVQTILLQNSLAPPPALPALPNVHYTGNIYLWHPTTLGRFVGNDSVLDLAVGSLNENYIYIFKGAAAGGFEAVSATNPVKLPMPMPSPVPAVPPVQVSFGVSLATASIGGVDTLLVGAPGATQVIPGVDMPPAGLGPEDIPQVDILNAGAVYAYAGGDIQVTALPATILYCPYDADPAHQQDYANAGLGRRVAAGKVLSGTGDDELLIGSDLSAGTLWLTPGLAALTAASWNVSGSGWDPKVIGDYDGDGSADLLVANDPAGMFIYKGGASALAAAPDYALGVTSPSWWKQTYSVAFVDGQGLFVANTLGQIVHIANDANGVPTAQVVEDWTADNFYLNPLAAPTSLYAGTEAAGSYLNTMGFYGMFLVPGNIYGCKAGLVDEVDFMIGSFTPHSWVGIARSSGH